MKVILARMGWMTSYNGPTADDERPIGGGAYNRDHVGFEVYNFARFGKKHLGHVQAESLNLKRIDAGNDSAKVDNVLVLFFAPRPDGAGQFLVGWYRNATVHRRRITSAKRGGRRFGRYNLEAPVERSTLLAESLRMLKVPHGKGTTGQAHVTYGNDERGNVLPWVQPLVKFVEGYRGPNVVNDGVLPKAEQRAIAIAQSAEEDIAAQGFSASPAERRAVEERAMAVATRYYERAGYVVKDTHKGRPYDLECSKGKRTLYVEVKGTRGRGETIFLTRREVAHANARPRDCVLFVVSGIRLKRSGRRASAVGGRSKVFAPWRPRTFELEPLAYACKLGERRR